MARLRDALGSSPELEGAARSADNALKLYRRTRPPAAPESAARAKALPQVLSALGLGVWVCGCVGWGGVCVWGGLGLFGKLGVTQEDVERTGARGGGTYAEFP